LNLRSAGVEEVMLTEEEDDFELDFQRDNRTGGETGTSGTGYTTATTESIYP